MDNQQRTQALREMRTDGYTILPDGEILEAPPLYRNGGTVLQIAIVECRGIDSGHMLVESRYFRQVIFKKHEPGEDPEALLYHDIEGGENEYVDLFDIIAITPMSFPEARDMIHARKLTRACPSRETEKFTTVPNR